MPGPSLRGATSCPWSSGDLSEVLVLPPELWGPQLMAGNQLVKVTKRHKSPWAHFHSKNYCRLPASLSSVCFRDSSGRDGKINVICVSPRLV